MGVFSWCFCDIGNIKRDSFGNPAPTARQRLIIGKSAYALVPEKFGSNIFEAEYDGYGRFAGKDIYALVADWNREFISEHPEYILNAKEYAGDKPKAAGEYSWYPYYADLSLSTEELCRKWREETNCQYREYRTIGIDLACYDEDNERLRYPIKISRKNACYEQCSASLADPMQGLL